VQAAPSVEGDTTRHHNSWGEKLACWVGRYISQTSTEALCKPLTATAAANAVLLPRHLCPTASDENCPIVNCWVCAAAWTVCMHMLRVAGSGRWRTCCSCLLLSRRPSCRPGLLPSTPWLNISTQHPAGGLATTLSESIMQALIRSVCPPLNACTVWFGFPNSPLEPCSLDCRWYQEVCRPVPTTASFLSTALLLLCLCAVLQGQVGVRPAGPWLHSLLLPCGGEGGGQTGGGVSGQVGGWKSLTQMY
jgi:hypothetical protein